ncbi:MAG: ABC transporter ATP-binding protein [Euryarchaeota archaeon]|nr:ABC transporter ATP-binding protein [Euryarchaeota archaeon]
MTQIVELEGVTKDYGNSTRALSDVRLSLRKGNWTTVMGPSGSGKTTMLNIIGCLDSPTGGKVNIAGVDIAGLDQRGLTKFRRENIGWIFQQYHLVPYLTALENVMLSQFYSGIVDEPLAVEMLTKVGIGHRLQHYPAQLSGGEQQRVCIARALVNEPSLILADEPTGNLDQNNGKIVLDLLERLREEGHTIIIVTHNTEIAGLGDRTIELVDGKISLDRINERKHGEVI